MWQGLLEDGSRYVLGSPQGFPAEGRPHVWTPLDPQGDGDGKVGWPLLQWDMTPTQKTRVRHEAVRQVCSGRCGEQGRGACGLKATPSPPDAERWRRKKTTTGEEWYGWWWSTLSPPTPLWEGARAVRDGVAVECVVWPTAASLLPTVSFLLLGLWEEVEDGDHSHDGCSWADDRHEVRHVPLPPPAHDWNDASGGVVVVGNVRTTTEEEEKERTGRPRVALLPSPQEEERRRVGKAPHTAPPLAVAHGTPRCTWLISSPHCKWNTITSTKERRRWRSW